MDGIDFEKIVRGCLNDCQKFLQDGIKHLSAIEDVDPDDLAVKEEFGINSRYLPRGFYCPSKVIEHYITNMRRGKIAQRKTKKPTNRFLFDKDGKLYYAETILPNAYIAEEYVFYKDNVVYGLVCNKYSEFQCCYDINVAVYDNGRISTFLWAPVMVKANEDHRDVLWMHYETYDYKEEYVTDVYAYSIKKFYKTPNTSSLVERLKMRCYTNENNNVDPQKIDWLEKTSKTVNVPLRF